MTLDDFLVQWHDDTPYITAHTSGSTGTPKDIKLLKSDMLVSARATNEFFGITKTATIASPLSLDYIAGKMMAVRALCADCNLITLPISNDIVIPTDNSDIDLLPVVPSQVPSLISQPHLAKRIKAVLIGGAAPSVQQCRDLKDCGYRAYISYGMTETCSHVALARADDEQRIFNAMPGVTFSTDSDGRLTIIAPKYSFKSLTTNDIVELRSNTSFIWRGRADGVINSGGIKFFPEELEAEYRTILGDITMLVRPMPHNVWGQAIELVIESPDGEIPHIADKLRNAITDHRHLPKRITFVDIIPRTANGKLRRH